MKLKLPNKKLFNERLKMNKWPVNWFDDKKKLKEERAREPHARAPSAFPDQSWKCKTELDFDS